MIYDIICSNECVYKDFIYCMHDINNITPNYDCIYQTLLPIIKKENILCQHTKK